MLNGKWLCASERYGCRISESSNGGYKIQCFTACATLHCLKRDSVACGPCEVRFQDVLRQSLKIIDCHSSESKSAAGKVLCKLERVSASYVIRCLNLSLFKKTKGQKKTTEIG